MDERLEAEAFSVALDRMLAGGRASQAADTEALLDLAVAARLRGADLSRESRVKHTLKNALLAGAAPSFQAPRRLRWGMAAAYAAIAVTAFAPIVAHYASAPENGLRGELAPGFDVKGAFPGGAADTAELGVSQLARGGLIGAAPEGVVTPLNVRDPSDMVLGGPALPRSVARFDGAPVGGFRRTVELPLSTFAVDVTAASYAEVRRSLAAGGLPAKDAVRVEELVNAFAYAYPEPAKGRAVSITAETAACPWNAAHKLVRIGLKGRWAAMAVKVQVEFNPARVRAYRLLGYEDARLSARDFDGEAGGASELGPGRAATALYEVVPAGAPLPETGGGRLKYQPERPAGASSELLSVKVRCKEPGGDAFRESSAALEDEDRPWGAASGDMKFAAAAAGFGMLLRESEFRGDLSFAKVRAMAKEGLGADPDGRRAEFLRLVEKAESAGMTPKILR